MPDAEYLIENPEKGIDPITPYTASAANYDSNELAKFRLTDTDIEKLIVKVLGKATGKNKKAPKAERINLRSNCLEAEFEDSIDKTPTFTLTIHDPDWSLLNTGTLEKPMDLNPGGLKGLWYRLDSFEVDDDRITLTFATRNAVFLSAHKRPIKASRGKVTRAEFILMLLRKVKAEHIRLYCPQLHKSQTTAKLTQSMRTSRQRGDDRDKGFTPSDKITVKNAPANPEQRKNVEEVIQAGIDKKAPSSLIVIALMVVAQESSALNSATNGQFVGCFQQSPAYGWVASRNAYKDAYGTPGKRGFFDAAIPVYKKMAGQDFGVIGREIQMPNGSWKASAVNRSYANDVNRWRDEAEHSVNSFGGVDVGNTTDPVGSSTYRAKYEFSVGPPENDKHETYLAGIYRLADEVNWRAYWVRDVLHYMSEEDLFKAKARARLRRYENGVEKVRFGWDKQKKINTMTLSVRMERWICPVGTVVIFDEGGPAQGRWLVTNVRRSMFDTLGEITLRKPIVEKREPVKIATRSPTDDSGTPTTNGNTSTTTSANSTVPDRGDLAYPLVIKGTNMGGAAAHKARPLGNWQSDNAIDIGCPNGTGVVAVADGTIEKAAGFYNNGQGQTEGLTITLRTGDNRYFYQHNMWRSSKIVAGAKVKKGDLMAHSGSGAGVPHLHFGVEVGDPEILTGWKYGPPAPTKKKKSNPPPNAPIGKPPIRP